METSTETLFSFRSYKIRVEEDALPEPSTFDPELFTTSNSNYTFDILNRIQNLTNNTLPELKAIYSQGKNIFAYIQVRGHYAKPIHLPFTTATPSYVVAEFIAKTIYKPPKWAMLSAYLYYSPYVRCLLVFLLLKLFHWV